MQDRIAVDFHQVKPYFPVHPFLFHQIEYRSVCDPFLLFDIYSGQTVSGLSGFPCFYFYKDDGLAVHHD